MEPQRSEMTTGCALYGVPGDAMAKEEGVEEPEEEVEEEEGYRALTGTAAVVVVLACASSFTRSIALRGITFNACAPLWSVVYLKKDQGRSSPLSVVLLAANSEGGYPTNESEPSTATAS